MKQATILLFEKGVSFFIPTPLFFDVNDISFNTRLVYYFLKLSQSFKKVSIP